MVRGPTLGHSQGWHPSLLPSTLWESQRHVCHPRRSDVSRQTLLTLASVSTTLTRGCLAGYLAMSHSKCVTKDVRSTGRAKMNSNPETSQGRQTELAAHTKEAVREKLEDGPGLWKCTCSMREQFGASGKHQLAIMHSRAEGRTLCTMSCMFSCGNFHLEFARKPALSRGWNQEGDIL